MGLVWIGWIGDISFLPGWGSKGKVFSFFSSSYIIMTPTKMICVYVYHDEWTLEAPSPSHSPSTHHPHPHPSSQRRKMACFILSVVWFCISTFEFPTTLLCPASRVVPAPPSYIYFLERVGQVGGTWRLAAQVPLQYVI